MTLIQRGLIDPANAMEVAEFQKFVCPPKENPDTPDRVTPDVTFFRKLMVGVDLNLPVPLPNGKKKVQMHVIADDGPIKREEFPSTMIRVKQGQIVHTVTSGGQDGHTIHHHGIEPTPVNDGVGHTSFEVGSYTFQWLASQAGTYFYHCHKNTVLHVELGMYGLLIVDPPQGEHFVAGFNPTTNNMIHYDVEALWAVDEIDPAWHELGHNAFMTHCGSDPNNPDTFTKDGILNDFRPEVFVISGIPAVVGTKAIPDPRLQINAKPGDTILVRIVHAGYTTQRFTFGTNATIIAMDGRPLGVPPYQAYSRPVSLVANTPFLLTSGMRHDLIIKAQKSGSIPVTIEFLDWVNGTKYATIQTAINVK